MREAPAAAEPAAAKPSRSPRPSFDRQRDLPLPDEPTTPAQQQEGPFLDAAASSIDLADAEAATDTDTGAAPAAQAVAAPAAPAEAAPAQAAAEPAAALDTQQQQQPGSPSSDAASGASPRSADSFSCSAPGNVVATLLIPRGVSGWLLGHNGATIQAHQVPGARWHLSDGRLPLGGTQDLRCATFRFHSSVVIVCALICIGHPRSFEQATSALLW